MLFGLALLPEIAMAQVVIKERVEISSNILVSPADSVSKTTSGISAPFDGWFALYFDTATKLQVGIDTSAEMVFLRNGEVDSIDKIILNDRLATPTDGVQNLCGGGSVAKKTYLPGSDPIWWAGRVGEGDQIQVAYDGKQAGFSYGTIYGPGPFYDITAGDLNCIAGGGVVVWNEVVNMTGVFVRDTLTLEIASPKEVWPTIPATGFQQAIVHEVENEISPITATVTANNSPVAGQEVEISIEWVDTSGGHIHNLSGDKQLSGTKVGSMTLVAGVLVSSTASTVVAETDQDGKVSVSFISGEFGGKLLFVATTEIAGKEYVDTDTLEVRVPGLTLIPDAPLSSYRKLGGTLDHPGPDDILFGGDYQHDPDYNHWVRPDVLLKLLDMVGEWNSSEPGFWNGNGNDTFWFNDASLPNGGLFDVNGRWQRPHNNHRVGRDVDIKATRTPNDGIELFPRTLKDGSVVTYLTGEDVGNLLFERIVDNSCVGLYTEFDEAHYHVYFYPPDFEACQ